MGRSIKASTQRPHSITKGASCTQTETLTEWGGASKLQHRDLTASRREPPTPQQKPLLNGAKHQSFNTETPLSRREPPTPKHKPLLNGAEHQSFNTETSQHHEGSLLHPNINPCWKASTQRPARLQNHCLLFYAPSGIFRWWRRHHCRWWVEMYRPICLTPIRSYSRNFLK